MAHLPCFLPISLGFKRPSILAETSIYPPQAPDNNPRCIGALIIRTPKAQRDGVPLWINLDECRLYLGFIRPYLARPIYERYFRHSALYFAAPSSVSSGLCTALRHSKTELILPSGIYPLHKSPGLIEVVIKY
jgi:hypothetical protein